MCIPFHAGNIFVPHYLRDAGSIICDNFWHICVASLTNATVQVPKLMREVADYKARTISKALDTSYSFVPSMILYVCAQYMFLQCLPLNNIDNCFRVSLTTRHGMYFLITLA